MITLLTVFLILTFILLLIYGFLVYLAWQKISIFLTYNTRYETVEYERAITTPKLKKPLAKAVKTDQRGRSITPTDDLVDIDQIDFDVAAAAIEKLGA